VKRIALFIFLGAICAAQAETPPRATLRVALWTLHRDPTASVTPLTGATLQLCETCPNQPGKPLTLQANNATLTWTEPNQLPRQSPQLLLAGNWRIAAHSESLTLGDPLRISAQSGALLFVATLPIERYVEQVVAAESGPADSPESLKALAVVARSFALQPRHGHAGFDVCDSTHCQFLRWRSSPQAHEAAQSTAGEVLWISNHRAEAFFHQNCGGRTAAASEVWPQRAGAGPATQKALLSREDPYCGRAGSPEWSTTLSRAQLTQALSAAGLAPSGWTTLTVAQRGPSGRAAILQIGAIRTAAEDFRLAVGRALGWNQIRSNWFEISPQGENFHFHGRGSGHGVGLCQTGAAEMAGAGKNDREILAQYFPNATAGEETTAIPWQSLPGQNFTLETSDPTDRQYLPALTQALAEAQSRSGLHPNAPIAVRAYRSTPVFRDATLAPGWVAAFTEGNRIALQPLRILAARRLLAGTARHEFLHALVETESTPQTPLWLREGLVEIWSGEPIPPAKPAQSPDAISQQLAHAASLAESQQTHRAAAWYASQLLNRHGRAQTLAWLRAGVPQSALGNF